MASGDIIIKAEESASKQIQKERIQELKRDFVRAGRPVRSFRESAIDFARQAQRQPEQFSRAQEDLRSLFGHGGGTFWGLEDSSTFVRVDGVLFRGAPETQSLFGMNSNSTRQNTGSFFGL